MYNLIVSDLDNTLLNNNKELTPYTARILNDCKRADCRVAFATARPERATLLFQTLFQPDFIISNNGATISRQGEIVYSRNISREIKNKLIRELADRPEITYLTAETGDFLYTNYRGDPWDNAKWNLVYTDFSAPFPEDTCKISVECADADLLNSLLAPYPELHLYSNSGENWRQIMHREATKMNAIRHLAQAYGIDIKKIVAFGDDYNDIGMLAGCGCGVAVANACDEARRAAAALCDSNDEDGVARWLESRLLKRHPKISGVKEP